MYSTPSKNYHTKTVSKCLLALFSSLFILALSAPLLCKAFDIEQRVLFIQENRALANFPFENFSAKRLSNIPKSMDNYFNDNMPFRSQLLSAYIKNWEVALGSPVKRYLTGGDGHLYLQHVSPTVFPYLGVDSLNKDDLLKVKLSFAGMHAFFKIQNITYTVAMIPDKTTLYPEYLPAWTLWKRGDDRYSMLQKALNEANINYIDLLETLSKIKNKQTPYNKHYDVEHWNGVGIAAASKEISDRAGLDSAEYLDKYRISQTTKQMFPWLPENVPVVEILNQTALETPYPMEKQWDSTKIILNSNSKNNKTLWFASDSYFLGTHTARSPKWTGAVAPFVHAVKKYVHMHYGKLSLDTAKSLMKEHKPDVVVEAFVERANGNPSRANDPLIRILGDSHLNTPGHILSPRTLHAATAWGASITQSDSKCMATASTYDPILILPSVRTGTDGRAVLITRMVSPVDTVAQLFFAEENATFSEINSKIQPVSKGENLIHMHFWGKPNSVYQMRFDPGAAPGQYTFLQIPEVNALKGGEHGL